jgi:hypothetical protein
VTRTVIAAILALLASAPAWADHGAGLRSPGMNPVVAALLWAAAAFLVGMAIVAIVTVLVRRRSSQLRDG